MPYAIAQTDNTTGELIGATRRWVEAMAAAAGAWVKAPITSQAELDNAPNGVSPVMNTASSDAAGLPTSGMGIVETTHANTVAGYQTWTRFQGEGVFERFRTTGTWGTWTPRQIRTGVSVDTWGAGPGRTWDSSPAITKAVLAANGSPVTLQSGATYTITPLTFQGVDVDLRTSGAEPATLRYRGFATTPLSISGTGSVVSTTLTESIGVHSTHWKPATTAGIQPGMLMTVESSTLWYHDHRDTAKRSELHKVVEIRDGRVVTEAPAFEGYDITKETVSLAFHAPVSVRLDNVIVQMDAPPISTSAPERIAVQVEWANEPVLDRVQAVNGLGAGISLRHSYRGRITDASVLNSCGFFTGYGLQVIGSSFTTIMRPYIAGSRRGVDVSGVTVVSRSTRIVQGVNVGGGSDSRNTPYGYTPTAQWGTTPQLGWGSHGPADDTVWDSCYSIGMQHHYTLRGRNERIINPRMRGRGFSGAIVLIHGHNFTLDGARLTTGWSGVQIPTNYQHASGSYSPHIPDSLVRIQDTYDGMDGTITIRDCEAEVQEALVKFDSATSVPPNLVVQNTTVRFVEKDASTAVFRNAGTTDVDRPNWVVHNVIKPADAPWGTRVTFPEPVSGREALDQAKRYADGLAANGVAPPSTGWRTLPLMNNSTGTVLVRRMGDQVWLRVLDLKPEAGTYAVHVASIPTSIAPDGEWFFVAQDELAGSPPSVYGLYNGAHLSWSRTTTNSTTRPTTPQSGSVVYFTKAQFPAASAYPGTAVPS